MNVDRCFEELNEVIIPSADIALGWEASEETMPEGEIAFLNHSIISELREYVGIDKEADAILFEVADIISKTPALKILCWHLHKRIIGDTPPSVFKDWPAFNSALGKNGEVLYLLVALSIIPVVKERHAKLNIDNVITKDTLRQIGLYCIDGQTVNGVPSVERTRFWWLRKYLDCVLFRIGRLEYKVEQSKRPVFVYKNNAGEITTLSVADLGYTSEGLRFVDDMQESEIAFTSVHTETSETITGNVVNKKGFVHSELTTLKKDEWACVFKPNDEYIDMHIPSGGGMSQDKVFDSFKKAFVFFRELYPEKTLRAISCVSWIHTPSLFEILHEESNLIKLMNSTHLFPVAEKPLDSTKFIFYKTYTSIEEFRNAPEETSLQRNIKKAILSDKRWCSSGGMFILEEELWGRE